VSQTYHLHHKDVQQANTLTKQHKHGPRLTTSTTSAFVPFNFAAAVIGIATQILKKHNLCFLKIQKLLGLGDYSYPTAIVG
jgi:hypothetical protein